MCLGSYAHYEPPLIFIKHLVCTKVRTRSFERIITLNLQNTPRGAVEGEDNHSSIGDFLLVLATQFLDLSPAVKLPFILPSHLHTPTIMP